MCCFHVCVCGGNSSKVATVKVATMRANRCYNTHMGKQIVSIMKRIINNVMATVMSSMAIPM